MSKEGWLYNVAYRDVPASENGIRFQWYSSWKEMIRRVYSETEREKFKTYEEVTVCKEWLLASNFKTWYEGNYRDYGKESSHLDKDILIKGNKEYSPDACRYIPARLNTLFSNASSIRGDYPCGVCKVTTASEGTYYQASCERGLDYPKYHEKFNNPLAAELAYLKIKVEYATEIIGMWVTKAPPEIITACYNITSCMEDRITELENLLTHKDKQVFTVLGSRTLTQSQVEFVYENNFSGYDLLKLVNIFGTTRNIVWGIKSKRSYKRFTKYLVKDSKKFCLKLGHTNCLSCAKIID